MVSLRQEARERRIISQCETFQRNPAGNQSRPAERASSRKRVLRGAGRPSPRSVDSEIKRCVIEPRNYHRREPSSWTLAGAEPGISYTWTHRRAWSHRGRRNMADDRTGFTGTWETLPSPSHCRLETRLNNSRLIRGPRPRPTGTNEGRNGGIAKRRKRSAAKRTARSRSVSQYR